MVEVIKSSLLWLAQRAMNTIHFCGLYQPSLVSSSFCCISCMGSNNIFHFCWFCAAYSVCLFLLLLVVVLALCDGNKFSCVIVHPCSWSPSFLPNYNAVITRICWWQIGSLFCEFSTVYHHTNNHNVAQLLIFFFSLKDIAYMVDCDEFSFCRLPPF